MKSIVYSLIAIFIISILIPSLPGFEVKAQAVTIQCVEKSCTPDKLEKSAEIITSRLIDYGLQDVKISVNESACSLSVTTGSDVDLRSLNSLLTSKGRIEFYEFPDEHESGMETALLDNSYITESAVHSDPGNGMPYLMISFDAAGTLIWKDVTKTNIGKKVAIALDKKVLYAPVVKSEISGGRCMITGDFTHEEMNMINALISNEELPLDLELEN